VQEGRNVEEDMEAISSKEWGAIRAVLHRYGIELDTQAMV